MSLVKKALEGTKTPNLFARGNELVDRDAFIQSANSSDFENWMNSLYKYKKIKIKDKHREELRNAYRAMIQGINDGRLTSKLGGGFTDSKGEWKNADKGFDAYGLVSGYLTDRLNGMKAYVAPEDASKIKFDGNGSIGTALVRYLYGSDSGNIQDFVDVDTYDEKTKLRPTTNRSSKLAGGYQYIIDNFDNLFTGFQDVDKKNMTANLAAAITALKDGTIDAGDFLALSKAASGLNYRGMFATGAPAANNAHENDNAPVLDNGLQNGDGTIDQSKFVAWVQQRYPQFTGTLHAPVTFSETRTWGTDALSRLDKALATMSNQGLTRVIKSILSGGSYKFNDEVALRHQFGDINYNFSNAFGAIKVLNAMKDRGMLHNFGEDNLNLYYVPSTENSGRQTAWVWDNLNNTMLEMSYHDIPYWREKIKQEYLANAGAGGGDNSYWTSRYMKQGGIVKAQWGKKALLLGSEGEDDGEQFWGKAPLTYNRQVAPKVQTTPAVQQEKKVETPLSTQPWYSGLSDFDSSKYTYNYNTSKLINGDMRDDDFKPWVSNVAGKGAGRYVPTNGNSKEYTLGVENQQYYKDFGDALFDGNGNFTDVGKAWALQTDANLPADSSARFFDSNGELRSSWTVKNNDVYGRSPHTFNTVLEYANYVRNDQILGSRHNVFANEGNRYFYKDDAGTLHWVDPNEIGKYTVSENPVASGWNDDNTVFWNDYELTGLKATEGATEGGEEGTPPPAKAPVVQEGDKEGGPSDVDPRTGDEKTLDDLNLKPSFGEALRGFVPDAIAASRLGLSIRTNNKVAKVIKESLKPVLKDTYELYSPITGAFSEMLFRNRQAANTQFLGKRIANNTSDASLGAAAMLDANRQATDLQYQGFLADDKEIQRTADAALQRQEDNVRRRSDVANFNRASINQTNREKAQLEATRLKSNWQSWDNFLSGVEGRMRTRFETDKERRENFRLQTGLLAVNDKYEERIKAAQQAMQAWKNDPQNAGKSITEMPGYQNYVDLIKEATRWKNAETYDVHAKVYGYRWDNPIAGKDWNTVAATYGYKNGGQLRPSVMYLINKVIKDESDT